MWVKLTPDEVKKAQSRFFRQRIILSIWITVVFFLLMTFFYGRTQRLQTGLLGPSSWNEIIDRIPGALVIAPIIGLFIFCVSKREKQNFACKKCGALKPDGDSTKCKCGGDFEDCRNLKWVDDHRAHF
ncbi:MAG TPA: hypothetical protein VGH42_11650 [Verrucomicrobiae bacterium]|jgi:hypothetical protein